MLKGVVKDPRYGNLLGEKDYGEISANLALLSQDAQDNHCLTSLMENTGGSGAKAIAAIDENEGRLAAVKKVANHGLRRGRLPLGLETLIDEYLLKAKTSIDPDKGTVSAEARSARRVLSDALVRFAEKLRVMANHDSIMNGKARVRTFDEIDRYVQMLQSVGNVILSSANELSSLRSHERGAEPVADLHRRASKRIDSGRDTAGFTDPKQVWDLLIAELNQAHVKELSEQGGKTDRAGHLGEAIKKATEYRANLVRIRPAWAYLRNSYTATSVQPGDNSVEWSNMLTDHAKKNIPLFGEALANDREISKMGKTLREIDKQHWQNVNRVRVAGWGTTDYAIIKDDLGNFNIKSYSSDPKPIIEAAKNMALFAASGPDAGNLIKTAAKRKKGEKLDLPPSAKQTQVDGIAKAQRVGLLEDLVSARENASGLPAALLGRWETASEIRQQDANVLKAEVAELKVVLPEEVQNQDSAEVSDLADNLYDSLGAFREFHAKVVSALRSGKLADRSDLDAAEKSAGAAQLALKAKSIESAAAESARIRSELALERSARSLERQEAAVATLEREKSDADQANAELIARIQRDLDAASDERDRRKGAKAKAEAEYQNHQQTAVQLKEKEETLQVAAESRWKS